MARGSAQLPFWALPDVRELARDSAKDRSTGVKQIMALDIKMPALSPTMEEGTLAKWLVKVG
ncbi:MAG: hypothetical protein C0472_07115, partial [Erythrobacter sp.]|nr:hypothetical protein [Erythrobacter sp.]